ncbi:Alpha/Beta hydrolase protein [Lophiotrema nucula]|uniref:Alpha/Beta hydrolase protein n=1 Tax=Lophiotrema nucula TaxID=690887 RepID=A0A6A5YW93_9PLEO|nr:Alpha/Beta hydrolase protein [Lophiotrema nucula]
MNFRLTLLTTIPILLLSSLIHPQCLSTWSEPQCASILSLESSHCTTYHIFVARGTDAKLPGRQGELIRLICAKISYTNPNITCGYENIEYSAKSRFVSKDSWCASADAGVVSGQRQMTAYAEKCPDSKLILLGYSQGASVALDIIGGGGGPVFECAQAPSPALRRNTSPGSKIAAIAVFGAVRRSANQRYSVKGGASFDGKAPRSSQQLRALNEYADILRDYCNKGDFICAVGSQPESLENHLSYFDLYNEEAAEWIVETALGRRGLEEKGMFRSAASLGTRLGYDSWTLGLVGAVGVGVLVFVRIKLWRWFAMRRY